MTRTISSDLQAHFAGEVTTLACCWKITRKDGVVKAFTDHDQDIVFDGVTYVAATGFLPSPTQDSSNFSVDNMEIDAILDSSSVTDADLMSGLYDFARILVFMVNYKDLTQGNLIIRSGWLGQVDITNQQYTAEIRGLSQKLQNNIGRVCSPLCDAILGDGRCTKSLTSFTFSATVTAVTDNQTFSASALTQDFNYFTGGQVNWTGGNNNGLSMEVKEFSNADLVLALAMPYTVQVGDTFHAIVGCDKSAATCKAIFNNLVNFRGFPSVPGTNAMLMTAGTIPSILL